MSVWVFTEESSGRPSPTALELLTAAGGFAEAANVFLVGPGSPETIASLGAHGATRVHHLDPGDTLPAAGAAAAFATLVAPGDLVLFGMGPTDRDVAGRLAARLGVPILTNAIAVDPAGATVVNEILGGTSLVETAFTGPGPHLVVVRPKSFAAEPAGEAIPETVKVDAPDTGRSGVARIVARHAEASQGPSLTEADVIVSGGRGMGDAERFGILAEIAGLLGAAVGATRAVVDSGWVPYSMQVGQTGKTVKPGVYLACGISGAMQHLVGMKDSGIIIAINKDEEAPIFGIADLGVVGDVHQVLPRLLEALRARSG